MLDELKKNAQVAAESYQIVWEKFDNDPDGRAFFLHTIQEGIDPLGTLETLHAKICSLTPNTPDSAGYTWDEEKIETYREAIEAELYDIYQLQALLDRYLLIENVLNDGPPLTNDDGQYILDI